MKSTRRKALAAVLSVSALAVPAAAQSTAAKKIHNRRPRREGEKPLYSEAISYGNLVFISGRGVADEGGVKVQTTRVLESIKASLEAVGSSMEKVLKANVYLKTLDDYAGMNDVFRGSFGPEPPVRTTVAVAGIPLAGCLVEIDVIAHL